MENVTHIVTNIPRKIFAFFPFLDQSKSVKYF